MASNPLLVVRPIQPLDNPHMCLHCKQSFSKKEIEDAMKKSPHCPRCHEPLVMGKTLVPSQEEMDAATRDGTMFRHADDADPHRIIFTGSFGVGKSTAINLLIDPSGETELAKEGNGAKGETQHVTQVFPADGQSGSIKHHEQDLALVVTDMPGFNDPDKKDAELMQEMSQALVEMSVGIDAIIHVVKMGRMAERDRELPELLLSGIASSADGRQELADRWVFLVTNCDGKRRKETTRDEVEQFRGQMQAFFPEILHKALSRAIFVENGRVGRDSPFGDAEKNRELILDQVISFRQTYHRCFSSPSLDKVVRTALGEAMKTRDESIHTSLPQMSNADVATLIKFFKTVKKDKKFQPMPSMVSAEKRFSEKWNSMGLATRDATAVEIAGKVLEKLKEPAYFQHLWKGNGDSCSLQ